jgi:hypothetical protein
MTSMISAFTYNAEHALGGFINYILFARVKLP